MAVKETVSALIKDAASSTETRVRVARRTLVRARDEVSDDGLRETIDSLIPNASASSDFLVFVPVRILQRIEADL